MNVAEAAPRRENYLAQNQAPLEGLFGAIDRQDLWSTDPTKLIENTQPWVKGDHHSPRHAVVVDDEQRLLANTYLRELRMMDEIEAPGSEYSQVVILGGMMDTNDRRTGFAKRQLNRVLDPIHLAPGAKIVYWAGPRDSMESEYADINRLAASTTAQSSNPWLKQNEDRPAVELIDDEVAQARLSFLGHLGDVALTGQRSYLRLTIVDGQQLWLPSISHYNFGAEKLDETGNIIVMNALPESRDKLDGKARHTTVSCAREWLEQFAPQNDGARVLFVTSNPYVRRTTAEVQHVVAASGADIEIVGCGPSAPEEAPIHLFLGEIGRSLYFFEG